LFLLDTTSSFADDVLYLALVSVIGSEIYFTFSFINLNVLFQPAKSFLLILALFHDLKVIATRA